MLSAVIVSHSTHHQEVRQWAQQEQAEINDGVDRDVEQEDRG
jgi:hypothetical protein